MQKRPIITSAKAKLAIYIFVTVRICLVVATTQMTKVLPMTATILIPP